MVGTFDGTINASGMKLYLNGSYVKQKASTVSGTGATGSLIIGRESTNAYFSGLIDEVRYYNRVITPIEVIQLYSGARTSEFTIQYSGGHAY